MSEHIPHRSDDTEPAASAAAPATERTGFVEFLHTEVAGAVALLTATIVALVAEGQTTQDILALYPDLEAEDIREALLFAAEAVRERALPLAAGE